MRPQHHPLSESQGAPPAIVAQDTFKTAIARAAVAVSGKTTLPVLTHLLLRAAQGRLTVTATNLDIGIETQIAAQVVEEGGITLPAKLLADVVGDLPNDQITLTVDSRTQTAKLVCGTFTSNIKGIEADEFPTIPSLHGVEAAATLPARLLIEIMDQVAPCAAGDDSRPVLAGVLLRLRNGTLTAAAADGFRLATRHAPITIRDGLTHEHIVPASALTKLAKVLGSEGDVEIRFSPGGAHIVFTSEAATLITRQIDGKFPDFERIIPTQYCTRSILETAELAKAAKLASYFASSSQHVVKLTMTPGGDLGPGHVQISANAAEVGDNTGDIDGTIHGDGGPIALNVKFLAEALDMIGTAQVAIETQTPQAPAVLKPVGAEGYVHVIMPMSIR